MCVCITMLYIHMYVVKKSRCALPAITNPSMASW